MSPRPGPDRAERDPRLSLRVLEEAYAVGRLDPEDIPASLPAGRFASITRTPDEASLVCAEGRAPAGARCESGFRCLQVVGPLVDPDPLAGH